MCHWVGSYFHNWIDYNGPAFSLELLEWDCTFFGGLGDQKIKAVRDLKMGRFYFIKFSQCVNSLQDGLVKRLYKVDAKPESY